MKIKIAKKGQINSCYFRTSMVGNQRKALIQITEKCNLRCAHCFVSAKKTGDEMSLINIKEKLIPELINANVKSVTLTGGEPLIHSNIKEIINEFSKVNMSISICSNGVECNSEIINFFKTIKNISVNISLDGFSENSHGIFRGNKEAFKKTIDSIKLLSEAKLLKGILSTPNNFSSVKEYEDMAKFLIKQKAKYLLMNPLSNFGRGEDSISKLGFSDDLMIELQKALEKYSKKIEIVNIRFPNFKDKPLSSCEAGNILYIFTNGDVAICPYLVFASSTKVSKYSRNEFIVANVFNSGNLESNLNQYNFKQKIIFDEKSQCNQCNLKDDCGKGCPAAIIATGQNINGIDSILCPINSIE